MAPAGVARKRDIRLVTGRLFQTAVSPAPMTVDEPDLALVPEQAALKAYVAHLMEITQLIHSKTLACV
jgi:hypothetical protein